MRITPVGIAAPFPTGQPWLIALFEASFLTHNTSVALAGAAAVAAAVSAGAGGAGPGRCQLRLDVLTGELLMLRSAPACPPSS